MDAQLVQDVPLLPSLQRVQKEALVHWVQLKMAEWQGRQVDPLM